MEKITFENEEEKVDFYVVEQTVLGGATYLLVTEEEEGEEDADAYILKEIESDGEEVTYEMVDDDVLLDALGKIFSELLEDVSVVS